jgi:siderophore synthetase component
MPDSVAITSIRRASAISAPATFQLGKQKTADVPALERVVRQLLEALLFERCIEHVSVKRSQGDGHVIYFSLGKHDFVCAGRIGGFDRLRLDMTELAELDGGKKQPVALDEMLMWILRAAPGDANAKNHLLDELLQSIFWLEWTRRNLPPVPARQNLLFPYLETALREGHPYHPCCKTRTGFNADDQLRYGYESAEPFQMQWLAVPRSKIEFRACDAEGRDITLVEFAAKQVPAEVLRAMKACNLDLAHYAAVPVHPWQWKNSLAPGLNTHQSALISLGEMGDYYLASQSQRTLMNLSQAGSPDVKLPLDIVCTSSRRNLLSHGICTSPVISQWLYNLVADDEFFRDHPLTILREFAGIKVDQSIYAPEDDPGISRLSAIWRENVIEHLHSDEQAVPATAIFAEESDGSPFIHPWVTQYELLPWLHQYFRVLILPVWHLLMGHGIALEAHAQNAVLIVRNGWPVRLALRDFHESLEYNPDYIAETHRIPDFASMNPRYRNATSNQFYWMDSIEALRELAMDTLFVFHLSELADICYRHYNLPEANFWQMLQALLNDYARSGHCSDKRLQRVDYTAPLIRTESLVRKKLRTAPVAEEYHHLVSNPFAEHY